ncbi:MAG: hypothetical protein KDK64_01540 [Chlamydiia bacterium]|nr:hypothetical protein [Chlamydiia bacterium]
MIKVIFGAFIGAIIAFVWSFISWTVLPWHDAAMNKFSNQEFVLWVMKENAPKGGVYVAPYATSTEGNLSPHEIAKNLEEQRAAMKKGPFVYAQIKVGGMDPTHLSIYVYSFLTQFAGAILICWLLKQATELSYKGRLLFVMIVGLTVGVLGFIPDCNWFGAGWKFTFVMIADLVITWFLAGLFLAAFIKESEIPDRELMM